jgi:hypothetical protein
MATFGLTFNESNFELEPTLPFEAPLEPAPKATFIASLAPNCASTMASNFDATSAPDFVLG